MVVPFIDEMDSGFVPAAWPGMTVDGFRASKSPARFPGRAQIA
jgi:hypothetical protein